MSKPRFTTQQMAIAGIIAAIYAALTLLSAHSPVWRASSSGGGGHDGPAFFLFPEAIPVLPSAVSGQPPGFSHSSGRIVGTAATLLVALWTSKLHHRALAPLPPVICNMVLVGAEVAWFSTQEGAAFWPAFAFNS